MTLYPIFTVNMNVSFQIFSRCLFLKLVLSAQYCENSIFVSTASMAALPDLEE